MKPSKQYLGHLIQQVLLDNHATLEQLADEMGLSPDGLSNLIHGRRRFRDEVLIRLAQTRPFLQSAVSFQRLRATRLMDEYSLEEQLLALGHHLKLGTLNPEALNAWLQKQTHR